MDIGDGIASRFVIGQRIALRVNRTRTGVVVGVLASRGSASRYRVFHGPDEREYDEDQLVADEADKGDALLDALAEPAVLPHAPNAGTFQPGGKIRIIDGQGAMTW